MPINTSINLKVVKLVAEALGELREEVLFVGGSVASLYANDPAASDPRPTKDIDVSVQVASYAEMNKLSELLAQKGFQPSPEFSVIYRRRFKDILVDFIPFEPTPLGPTNTWLKPGFEVSEWHDLEGTAIRILPVSYFLASKWEAFLARGKDDPLTSHDLEDFIYVMDYHLHIVQQISSSDNKVKPYLQKAVQYILDQSNRDAFIEAQLIPSIATDRRLMIVAKMEQILTET
ncbi:MAG: hypothetical protein ABJG78_02930 [Cyclobacteriaceae bacterium]